jgi:zinc protease
MGCAGATPDPVSSTAFVSIEHLRETFMKGPAGSHVLVEENHDLPLVRILVALRVGAAEDPIQKDGLANFTAELFPRGTMRRSRTEVDAAFDALGTSLDISTGHEGVTFEVTVVREKLDAALALVAEVLLHPRFSREEADKLRRELKSQIDELRDHDALLARRFFQRALFGEHPYGRSVLGTEASLERLTVDDAKKWHQMVIHGDNVIFGLAGDVEGAGVPALLARHFGELPSTQGASGRTHSDLPNPPLRSGVRVTLVDKPGRTQSQIFLGHPAPGWSAPDFYALQVATHAFGGTFTARLLDEVRSKRGLSYGASAHLMQGRGDKALVVNVYPALEQTAETLELVLRLYREWAEGGLRDEEVAFAQGNLAESFAFHVATPEDRLDLRATVELAGMPPDYANHFSERILAVKPSDVRRAMAAHLRPSDLEICILSTVERLRPFLEQRGLLKDRAVTVFPYDSF